MNGIPGDLYQRVQAALLRCGPFDSDRALRPLFVDARLSAWRDLLPEANNRVEQAQAVIEALSERANPDGENALALLLRILAENTSPGDACHGQLAAMAKEVAAAVRADAVRADAVRADAVRADAVRADAHAGPTVFGQRGQQVGTQINVAGNYYANPKDRDGDG